MYLRIAINITIIRRNYFAAFHCEQRRRSKTTTCERLRKLGAIAALQALAFLIEVCSWRSATQAGEGTPAVQLYLTGSPACVA